MRIAVIPPTKYLRLFCEYQNNQYHLALAHRVLSDDIYMSYYKEKSVQGHYVILDNGACELGESIRKEDLLRAAELIQPTQIILPDKLNDAEVTIRISTDFIKFAAGHLSAKVTFMAVTQGVTRDEWLNCYNEFSNNTKIKTIGISNTDAVYPNHEFYFSRVETIKFLSNQNLINKNQTIHLLGLNNSGHMELDQLKQFKFIEGVDSSAPIVHGAFEVEFEYGKQYTKIRKYLDPDAVFNDNQIKHIKKNLSVLFNSAK